MIGEGMNLRKIQNGDRKISILESEMKSLDFSMNITTATVDVNRLSDPRPVASEIYKIPLPMPMRAETQLGRASAHRQARHLWIHSHYHKRGV